MASTDARPVPEKNVAYRVYFPIFDNTGALVAGATIDSGLASGAGKALYSGDAVAAVNSTNSVTELTGMGGAYYLDLTAAEMNMDGVVVTVRTTTANAKNVPISLYPEETGDIRVSVTAMLASVLTSIAAAVWDRLTSLLVTAGSIGEFILTLSGVSGGGSGTFGSAATGGGYRVPLDIANRALDHVGSETIDAALGFSEPSKNARVVSRVYDKLRQAELRRNVWRFAIRSAALRAIDVNTMLLAPSLWVSTTTYFVGSIVAGSNGQLWISQIPNNLNNQPELSTTWAQYFGPMTVMLYDSTTTYAAGELVYTAAGAGTNRVFISLQSANADNPVTATAWAATATYFLNQVVTYLGTPYMSLVDLNTNQTPATSPLAWTTTFTGGAGSLKWLQIGGAEFPMGVTLTTLNIVYPLGSGPSSQSSARKVYRLPSSYLRQAPQDPKAGGTSYLGAPSSLAYTDWTPEGNYIVTAQVDTMYLRFVADWVDVAAMDPMFCEGLAARIGMEICETITQSSQKVKVCADFYKLTMGEARTVNAIETGSEQPPTDDYIATRG